MEYLSRLLKKETIRREFNFHAKCESLRISHLIYADDLMLLSRGDSHSVGILLDCLRDFGDVSGLRMNVLKSSIYTAGISDGEMAIIDRDSCLPHGSLPFRYLGIPLAASRLRLMDYEPFITRIVSHINAWKGSSLSYAGRLQLVRSVLQGVVSFWISIFPIPMLVRDRITKHCRRFLWGSRTAPVAWKTLCAPKEEGGLGLRDLGAWNSALLSKLLWDIHAKKDSLWVRWMDHVYLKGRSIWDWTPGYRVSPLVSKLFTIRDTLLDMLGSTSRVEAFLVRARGHPRGSAMAYELFRPKPPRVPWASVIWPPCTPPKYSFITWLGIQGRLKTMDRLRFIEDADPTCNLCGLEEETAQHMFFVCPFSSQVWKIIRHWMGIHRAMSTLRSSVKWLKLEARGKAWTTRSQRLAFATTVYFLWLARNRKRFEGTHPDVDRTVRDIKTYVYKIIFALYPNVLHTFESLAAT